MENPPSSAGLEPIQREFLASGDAIAALAQRSAKVDRTVTEAAIELLIPAAPAPAGVAVLAVGGYGRRQLFPYSDVDLLLLFESERLAVGRKSQIAAFLQRLWDSGLRVSHSVRTPAECAEVHDQNIELNVSLLDQRYLAGNRALYAGLAEKLPVFIQRNREPLSRNLAQLTRERHEKYAHTFYHLEPNVKETPGGMRDYQLICWLQQLQGNPGSVQPDLDEAFRFLARLRCYLHYLSGRDNNVLSFDAQDAIAEQWHETGAAAWMRGYYRHARDINRAAVRTLETFETQSSKLFAQFRDWRSRLSNAEFSVHRERAHFRAPQQLDVEPEVVLRLFEFVGRHGIRPSFEAERQIESRIPRLREWFGEPRPLWPALERIFSLEHSPMAARSMHETGVLPALFPEWEPIECLVIRDFYHRYTVDEHSLVAAENLWALRAAGNSYADLLAEVQQPALLLFALLFHDAGKAAALDLGHVAVSAKLAESAMRRVGMPLQDRETVLFLIRRHLDLSSVMQSRDVYDPQAIQAVAHQMGTVERLKGLTLLTYADISAVNPGVMTPWRAGQLWQLYLRVYNELTRELETERIETAGPGAPGQAEFLAGLPTRYLRTHTDAEVAEHMALLEKSRSRGLAVDIRRLDSAWRLTLVATDRQGLFAAVAGTLSSFGMNILKAEAFANRYGLVLDTFTFADPLRTLELNPTEVDRLHSTIERGLAGKLDVRQLLRHRPKPKLPSRKAGIWPSVSFNSEASASATLIEIVAEDRPGLLYDLASAVSSNGGNIEVVLIDTQAHKALDVFYVTSGGKKLSSEEERVLGEALRRACRPG